MVDKAYEEYLIGTIKMYIEMFKLDFDENLESKSAIELEETLDRVTLLKEKKLISKVIKNEPEHTPYFKNGDMTGQAEDDEMNYEKSLIY